MAVLVAVLLCWTVAGAAAAPAHGAGRAWQPAIGLTAPDGLSTLRGTHRAANGDLIAVWSESTPSSSESLKVARVTPTGIRSAPVVLDGRAGDVVVASDSRGRAVVMWDSPAAGATRLSLVSDDGAVTPVAALPSGDFLPRLAVDATGRYAVASARYANGRAQVWLTRGDLNGGARQTIPVSDDLPISLLGQTRHDVAMGAEGQAIVVWHESSPSGARTVLREVTAGGLGPIETLSSPDRIGATPSIGSNAAGEAAVTWVELSPGASHGPVMAAVRPHGGPAGVGRAIGGTVHALAPVPVQMADNGEAGIIFREQPTTAATLAGGIRLGFANARTGQVGDATPLPGLSPKSYDFDLGAGGHGALVFTPSFSDEIFVMRRDPGGPLQTASVAGCPPRMGTAAAELAPDGAMSLVWRHAVSPAPGVAGLSVAHDRPAAPGELTSCTRLDGVRRAPFSVRAYSLIAFDARAFAVPDADAGEARFEWDFDGNGQVDVTENRGRARWIYKTTGPVLMKVVVTQGRLRPIHYTRHITVRGGAPRAGILTSPTLFPIPARRTSSVRTGGVPVPVRAGADAPVRLRVTMSGRQARDLGLRRRIGHDLVIGSTLAALRAGESRTVFVRLTTAARRALTRRPRVVLRVNARHELGTSVSSTIERIVTLRR